MEINKNDAYKLNVDDLSVDSFHPVAQPEPAQAQAFVAQEPVGVVWTGCMSECTECTF